MNNIKLVQLAIKTIQLNIRVYNTYNSINLQKDKSKNEYEGYLLLKKSKRKMLYKIQVTKEFDYRYFEISPPN